MYKVLGIDPGLADTGIGLITGKDKQIKNYSFGCITTSKKDSTSERLFFIYSKLKTLIKTEKPDLIVAEDVFSIPVNPTAGISLGKVIGVITIAVLESKLPQIEMLPKEFKQRLTGNGNAGKKQIEKTVRTILKHTEEIKPYHSADALGLAIIGFYDFKR